MVARGDDKDANAGTHRELPPLGGVVVFEQDSEDGPGHEVAVGSTYRIITIDDVLLALLPPLGRLLAP